jgi:DNA-binding transcriptional ArsR family regulator
MEAPPADRIRHQLSLGPASAAELAKALGVHQSTISRAIASLQANGEVVRLHGPTRGARYGLTRRMGSAGSSWPLYRVDAAGTPVQLGTLHALARDQYYLRSETALAGLSEGIPYPLQDARPAGFLGRTVPQRYPELDLPPRVNDWSDEHFLRYLTQRGADCTGDLILGTAALDHFLAGDGSPEVPQASCVTRYPELARQAMAGTLPGSSAHGEHPKFTARLHANTLVTHVLVKFSPARTTLIGQRWADLLLAEHWAHQVLREHGITAVQSRWLECGEQAFLETQRFDRIGPRGRRGAVSLLSVDACLFGALDNWTRAAERLERARRISQSDASSLCLLDAFGELIANTDRHFGNVTLFDQHQGRFELAPVYDMLPMLFAPQQDFLIERTFIPLRPKAASLGAWRAARALALTFWDQLTTEMRLSPQFRQIATACREAVNDSPAL